MASSDNARRLHAQLAVTLAREAGFSDQLETVIGSSLDAYCDSIQKGAAELEESDLESIRFLRAMRAALVDAPGSAD